MTTSTNSMKRYTTTEYGKQNMFAAEPQIEVMHTRYHALGEYDAHGFCSNQEFVKDLQRQVDNY